MAKTQALGTVLKQGTTVVGHLTSFNPGGAVKTEIDVTDFDSTAAENLPGLPDFSEATFGGWFDYADAGQTILRADAEDVNATTKSWTVEFTRQAAKVTFDGWVKSYVPGAGGPNDAYNFTTTIRRTGPAVWAALP